MAQPGALRHSKRIEVGMSYRAVPTEGTGGALTDEKNIEWNSGRKRSLYHRKASHLTGPGPWPLVIHLHGDGYEEFTRYGEGIRSSVGHDYEAVAVAAGALFVMPRTPDTKNETWYDKKSSTKWLVAFVTMIEEAYNVDKRRIFFSGYSGGAEELSYNLVCDHHALVEGGGAMMLGGGGAEGLVGLTGTPSAAMQNDFLLRWWTGDGDNGRAPSDPSIDAVSASVAGLQWYAGCGFNTARALIPGTDHYTSEPHGPDKLAALIRESNGRYGI